MVANDVRPWTEDVEVIEQSASMLDPQSGEIVVMFHEFDPYLTEFTGEPKFKALLARKATIRPKYFKDGFAVTLEQLRLPHVREMYAQTANRFGQAINVSKRRDYFRSLINGDAAAAQAPDGQNFFDTDHPGTSVTGAAVTQSNLFDLALSDINLLSVITAMQGFRNVSGAHLGNKWRTSQMANPMDSREMRPTLSPSFHMYVGPKNSATAAELANMATTAPEVFAGTFTWDSIDELTGDYEDYWFVRFLTPNTRPLLYMNGGESMTAKADIGDEPMRYHNRAEWIVDANWGFGYRDWHCISMSRGA